MPPVYGTFALYHLTKPDAKQMFRKSSMYIGLQENRLLFPF